MPSLPSTNRSIDGQPQDKKIDADAELQTLIKKAMCLARSQPSTNYEEIFARIDRNEPDKFPEPPSRPKQRSTDSPVSSSGKKKGSMAPYKKKQSLSKQKK